MREGEEGRLWGQVRGWLRGSMISKMWQARVVEACVESSLLYDCQARVWYKKDVRALQSWIDKCYRWVWSGGRRQPLRRMQAQGENMRRAPYTACRSMNVCAITRTTSSSFCITFLILDAANAGLNFTAAPVAVAAAATPRSL